MATPPGYETLQEDMPNTQGAPTQSGPGQQQVQLPPAGSHIPLGAYPPAGQLPPAVSALPAARTRYAVQTPPQRQSDPNILLLSRYRTSAGVVTGSIQLCCGILALIFSSASFAVHRDEFQTRHSSTITDYVGMGIWSAIVFFIPAGILGVLSKGRNSGVIVAYLTMCILAAVSSASMIVYESMYSVAYLPKRSTVCVYRSSYIYDSSSYGDYGQHSLREIPSQSCYYTIKYTPDEVVIALHSVLAIIAFVQFVVAIVGSAFSCGGLCCGSVYYYCSFVNPNPVLTEPQPHVIQVARSN